MMFCKVLVAVPEAVDVRDRGAVLELMRRMDPLRDLHFSHGVADALDHATATPGAGSKLLIDLTCLDQPDEESHPFEFLFDPAAAELTFEERLWLGLANLDPARDITIEGRKVTVDCRTKKLERWPNVVASSEETIRLVDERRAEYGLGEKKPSPSARYVKLNSTDGAEA